MGSSLPSNDEKPFPIMNHFNGLYYDNYCAAFNVDRHPKRTDHSLYIGNWDEDFRQVQSLNIYMWHIDFLNERLENRGRQKF
jgi:hypothetical protein